MYIYIVFDTTHNNATRGTFLTYTPPLTLQRSRRRSADRRCRSDMGGRRPLASASAIFFAATVTRVCHSLLRARAKARSW